MANDGAIIIKRIKKGDHGGHHGGAWKVAYADFVTAMMAFFLLMWLINTTTPEQKRGIADYFAAQSISQTSSGSGGVLGGTVLGQASARAGGAASLTDKSPPSTPSSPSHSKEDAKSATAGQNDDHTAHTAQDQEFSSAAESIRQAMQEMPDIAALSRQVIIDQTPEGMRIQLVDQDGKAMFEPGSAEPMPYTRKLLATIAGIIDRLPNRISITGHTDGQASEGGATMTNWQLSAARADAARAVITGSGVKNDRIYEISGKAGSEPLLPEDPNASANHRLSIVLMKEAPPVPADHKL